MIIRPRKNQTLTGAEALIQALIDLDVDVIFGYPGGAVLPIYDTLGKQKKIRHILARHEQGAVHAAEGYARSTGKPGVVLVTSGPGVTNCVTGVTDAMLDSIPLVVLCGQVATHLIGTDAFQECDTVGITRHCSKHNYLIKDSDSLARTIHEAFYIATSGRPGPVVVDIPKDIQIDPVDYTPVKKIAHKTYVPPRRAKTESLKEAIALMRKAKQPVIYTGGGVINSGVAASQLLQKLVRITGFPITSTLMGLGAYPASQKNYLGMLGMHGTYEANMAMHDADLILCLGARFDDRVTGRLDGFSPNSKRIHADVDRSSINKIIPVDIALVGDVGLVIEDLIKLWKSSGLKALKLEPWWKKIKQWRAKKCLDYEQGDGEILPQHAVSRLYEATRDRDVIISSEVGQHQMWVAQFYRFEKPNRWLTSGGLGTMGYGLPAAIGAQIGNPNSLVIDIAGDASILMNIQEMGTAFQYRLPIKVFILNNSYMGMVRQWQELTYEGHYAHSYSEALPDFVQLAKAWGWNGIRIDTVDELDEGIAQMLKTDGPVIVDCRVKQTENCFPMIPSGAAHNEIMLTAEDVSGQLDEEAQALV